MKYDQLIVKPGGVGAMALFQGEVVAVTLNGRIINTDQQQPEKKVVKTTNMPRVRNVLDSQDQPTYVPFVEAP